jgi:hypothetical protein
MIDIRIILSSQIYAGSAGFFNLLNKCISLLKHCLTQFKTFSNTGLGKTLLFVVNEFQIVLKQRASINNLVH